jgi:glycosyltransferase involved in cell wall biosynthesis
VAIATAAVSGLLKRTVSARQIQTNMRAPIKVVHLISHPIQYFVPLYRELARRHEIDLTVMFYSMQSAGAYRDSGFGKTVKWDVPMLDGYQKYISVHAASRAMAGGFDLRPDWDILRATLNSQCDVVWASGYQFLNTWLAAAGQIAGYRLLLRDEQTLLTERAWWKRAIKRLTLPLLFRNIWGLYIGEENRQFFRHYGARKERLFPARYCVDNAALCRRRDELRARRTEIRANFGIHDAAPVILFSGKLIDKKKPQLLLESFRRLRQAVPCHLLFVGDGCLRPSLEQEARDGKVQNVHFTGFLNQGRIAEAYVAADLFVLPSAYQETWGLVVNEAMNFGLPIVVSDRVGCGTDLVRHGENGFIFPAGDGEALRRALATLTESPALRHQYGLRSEQLVGAYSIKACADQIVEACQAATATRRARPFAGLMFGGKQDKLRAGC